MSYQCIDQDQALSLIHQEDATVVDIRDQASYEASHIKGAIHLSNDSLHRFLSDTDKTRPVIVCCYHGNSSKSAADFLFNQGFSQSFSLDGGFSAWQQTGSESTDLESN